MQLIVVDDGVIDDWLDHEPDGDVRLAVAEWLLGFMDGPGFADGVPSLSCRDLFRGRVPGTAVVGTYLVRARLDPPAIAIRKIS